MADNDAPEGQAPAGGEPQAGAPSGGQAPATPPTPQTPPDDDPDAGLSPEDLRKVLKKTREEAASARTKNRELEEKVQAAEREKLSEAERLKLERDEAVSASEAKDRQIRTLEARSVIFESATKLGFRNPEIAHRLVDLDKIEFTDDGRPKGIDALLKKVIEGDPYLAKGVNGADYGGGPRGGSGSGVDMNDVIRRAAGKA